jgi:hypothetical protein
LLLGLLFASLSAGAQTAGQPVSAQKVVQTPAVVLRETADTKMDASLFAEGSLFFLQLAGWGVGANTINTNEMAILLLDNDSTITVQAPTIQGFEENNAAKTYQHRYAIRQQDLETLQRHAVKGLRKYSVLGFDDIPVAAAEAENFQTLCHFFLEELDKAHLLKPKSVPTTPSFPGGKDVLLSFLNRNLKALPLLKEGEQRTAIVAFQVKADGSVANLQLKQSAGAAYDNELLRIFKRMPLWKPALLEGQRVDLMVAQPVYFYQQNTAVKVRF